MEIAIAAARWVVGRALSPVTDGLLESWAASSELGPNVTALKLQLLYAQAMLDNARGREVRSPALGQLLQELQHHAYNADDVLDELEYFRIQDEVKGTCETTDGWGLVLNTRHTARAVASKLKIPSFSCAALKFDRVEMSKRMAEIVEQLKPVCAMVSTILDTELLGSAIHKLDLIASNSTTSLQGTAINETRSTTSQSIEPKLYGRDELIKGVVDGIIHGKNTANDLTVLSIVGPGGLGKTAFTQEIFQSVKSHFQVLIWVCVSQNKFNANRLAQEIVKKMPKADNEKENASNEELIETRLLAKQFLLVLDDIWTCHEDEWNKLLAPLKKGGTKGNMVIVTTRILQVADMVTTADCRIKLEQLQEEDCMHFFQACVFGDQQSWENHTNLHDVGSKIVKKLKGFPLAVKTVGRLLKRDLTLDHWKRVLDSKEWEYEESDNDIMPALKLSYNYLPFHLQQCFSHSALFPEDYEFGSQELIHFWIGLGLLGANKRNKRTEDIGIDYLNDLVSHGFFEEEKTIDGNTYFVIHDLLHDLAVNVSACECLTVQVSNASSIQIPTSISHISIITENTDVQDRVTFEDYKRDLYTLDKILKAENLRTLMLFGDYHGSFCKPFSYIFREAKALRVIFLSGASYDVEDLLHNFSQLVHLRYLRINGNRFNDGSLSSSVSRLYNLVVLDLRKCKIVGPTRKMSNLVKIRHFVVDNEMYHSGIYEVGKLKNIQELRRFEVKREKQGFELSQLSQLRQVQGSLEIHNLAKVEDVTEADGAKLVHMHHLNRLLLDWGTNGSDRDMKKEEDVLERLKPHNNLREVCIRGHGGGTYPSWLATDHSIKHLECLRLEDVSWKSLPPLGELLLVDEEHPCITGQIFNNLKRLELIKINTLKNWRASSPFCHLEILIVRDCSELLELPFKHYNRPQTEQENNITLFPRLEEIQILKCSKLETVPQIPWSNALNIARLDVVGTSIPEIDYSKKEQHIEVTFQKDADDLEFWNVLSFSNMGGIRSFEISECPPVPLHQLQKLTSLKTLVIWSWSCDNVLWPTECEENSRVQLPVEQLTIYGCGATGKELAQLISYFPNLSHLELAGCNSQSRGVEEKQAAREGLLSLPLQIKELHVVRCPDVRLCSSMLQSQNSLQSLFIRDCPEILSSSSPPSRPYCPFPTSLQYLFLSNVKEEDMLKLAPLTNLTRLSLRNCGGLRSEDLCPLLAQGHIKKLTLDGGSFNLLTNCLEFSRTCAQDLFNSRVQNLETVREAGTVAVPTPSHPFSSLTTLSITEDDMEHFTREQSVALQMLTSLQELEILDCGRLQYLPPGLSGLRKHKMLQICCRHSIPSLPMGGLPSSLTKLQIVLCNAIQSLPKGTLPSSLMELSIRSCKAFRSLPEGAIPSSLVTLEIINCPTIRSLHEGSLPSSLQTLDVTGSNEKLQRQCRKLIGTIPVVLVD